MKKLGYDFPWREAGFAILGGIIFTVALFYFPDATSKILVLLAVVGAIFAGTAWVRLRRNQKRVEEITVELAAEISEKEQFRPPKKYPPANLHKQSWRYVSRAAFCVAVLGALLIQYFRRAGSLTPHKETLLTMIVALAASIFFGWNLIWGVIEEQISVRNFPNICRKESPCNYWVAIGGYAILTGGFLSAFASKLIALVSQ